MKGGIYSDERCPICDSVFKDDHRSCLSCPTHPNVHATSHKVIFGRITKRFKAYDGAYRFLTGLRFKTDEQTFDDRDYRRDNPLGFLSMSRKYVDHKSRKCKKGSFKNIRRHIEIAQEYFNQMNVKEIRYGHLEDFEATLTDYASKTKHNIFSTLHDFFCWLKRRQEIENIPDFPVIEFDMAMRRTISKDDQACILDELKKIAPPKVWLGIKMLCTYISIRPAEMISIKEGEIDPENGYLYFPHPKEKKFKPVPILREDAELLKTFLGSFPAMPLFRHGKGISGVAENESYGEKYFYKWWKRACANLGIEGIDLYGGTMHSSTRALRAFRTPEEIKKATMRSTSKAFNRYFDMESDDVRAIYQDTGKVVDFVKVQSAQKKH